VGGELVAYRPVCVVVVVLDIVGRLGVFVVQRRALGRRPFLLRLFLVLLRTAVCLGGGSRLPGRDPVLRQLGELQEDVPGVVAALQQETQALDAESAYVLFPRRVRIVPYSLLVDFLCLPLGCTCRCRSRTACRHRSCGGTPPLGPREDHPLPWCGPACASRSAAPARSLGASTLRQCRCGSLRRVGSYRPWDYGRGVRTHSCLHR